MKEHALLTLNWIGTISHMIEEGGGGGREVQCSLVSFDSESSVEFSSLFIYVIGRV